MSFSKACKKETQCSRGRVWVDTTEGLPHLYKDLNLVCPADMPASNITQGNTGAIYYQQYDSYLEGMTIGFSTD